MSYDPQLTHFHSPQVEDLLRNNVKIGQSLDLGNKRSGTAVGFAKKYIGRGGLTHKHAGVYIDFATAIAAPYDGGPDELVTINLGSMTEIANIHVRIRDLPKTPFWEGDVVSFATERCTDLRSAEERFVIERINYSVTAMQVSMRSLSGSSAGGPLSAMRLIERGKIWKFEHGEPLNFSDIKEEAKFHQSLGMSEKVSVEVVNPVNMPHVTLAEYHEFDIADSLKLVLEGKAHQLKLKDRRKMTFVLIRYEDRTFGERVRQDTLRHLRSFESAGGHPVL